MTKLIQEIEELCSKLSVRSQCWTRIILPIQSQTSIAGGLLDFDEWRHVQTKASIQQINKSFALLNHFIEINFINNNEFLDHTRISCGNQFQCKLGTCGQEKITISIAKDTINRRGGVVKECEFQVNFFVNWIDQSYLMKEESLLYWWVGNWTIAIKVCFLGMWRYIHWPRQDLNKDIIMDGL